jgi:tripartite-type tricarboxylate transporter receptor subunit TctC
VPTVIESGFTDIEVRMQWIGAFALAGTPPAIVQKLETALRQAAADPGVRDKLKTIAFNPDGRPGEAFRKLIDDDIKAHAEVVKAANLKFE